MTSQYVSSRWGAVAVAIYLFSAVLTGVSVLTKSDVITSILPLPGFVMVTLLTVAVFLPLFFIPLSKIARFIAPAVLLGVWAVVLVVQPRVTALHKEGRGTDQGDCIIVGSHQLLHGQWPYDRALMWSHYPMSCGPGWIGLQAPTVATIGYPVTMAAMITIAAAIITALRGWRFASVFVTLVGLSPGFWLAYANGNDFVSFGLAVAVVVALAGSDKRALRIVAAILSVAVAHARAPFVLLPAFALTDRQSSTKTRRSAVAASIVSVVFFAAFYLWNPALMVRDGPLHILEKFSDMLGFTLPPAFLAIGFLVVSIALAALLSRFPTHMKALLFSTIVLVPLALLSLVTALQSSGGFIHGIEFWEGVSWLTPLVCISAYAVAEQTVSTPAIADVEALATAS